MVIFVCGPEPYQISNIRNRRSVVDQPKLSRCISDFRLDSGEKEPNENRLQPLRFGYGCSVTDILIDIRSSNSTKIIGLYYHLD